MLRQAVYPILLLLIVSLGLWCLDHLHMDYTGPKIGSAMPALQVMDLQGRRLSSDTGESTLLYLFHAGCRACEKNLLRLVKWVSLKPRMRYILLSDDPRALGLRKRYPVLDQAENVQWVWSPPDSIARHFGRNPPCWFWFDRDEVLRACSRTQNADLALKLLLNYGGENERSRSRNRRETRRR